MDCKYTSQSVKMSRTVYRQTLEHPFDTEVLLPDYCPDIHRVLKCLVTAKIAQRSADGGCINLDGIVSLNLIYSDKDCNVRSFDMQTPFSKSADFTSDASDVWVTADCRTDYCNCRAINERSVDVHAAISIAVCVHSCIEARILTDIDEPSVQLMRSSAPASSPSGRCEKYLLLNDEVSLPDRCPAIRNIMRHDMSVIIREKKLIGSKVMIKGELNMNVMYFGEETADCERFSDAIPFSQIMEIPGINDGCTFVADADIVSAELMPRTGMSGDMRVISVSVKLYLTAAAYCDGEVPLLKDAYSTKYDMQLDYEDVCFEKVVNGISDPYQVKYTLDIPITEDLRIVDMWCTPSVLSVAADNGGVSVHGSVQFCLITRDKTGEPSYFERTYDFASDYKLELPEKCELKCSVGLIGCSATAAPSGAEVKADLEIMLDVIEQTVCSVLSSAQFGEEHARRCRPSSVVVYFASDGEKLWDIARRYSTSSEAIASVNSLTGDKINGEMTLVIPSI